MASSVAQKSPSRSSGGGAGSKSPVRPAAASAASASAAAASPASGGGNNGSGPMMHVVPPASACSYAPCFCEENVWKLCEHIKKVGGPNHLTKASKITYVHIYTSLAHLLSLHLGSIRTVYLPCKSWKYVAASVQVPAFVSCEPLSCCRINFCRKSNG